MSSEKPWFVIYAAEDDSHSLIPSADVICEENVEVGDEVRFVYGSRKRPIEGVVKAMGDDPDALSKTMKGLNKKSPKRLPSFNADKPRSAKLRCQSNIMSGDRKVGSGKPSKSGLDSEMPKNMLAASGSSKTGETKSPGTSILGTVLSEKGLSDIESEDDGKVTDVSDSSSNLSDLTQDEIRMALKVAKANKAKDVRTLSGGSKKSLSGSKFLDHLDFSFSDGATKSSTDKCESKGCDALQQSNTADSSKVPQTEPKTKKINVQKAPSSESDSDESKTRDNGTQENLNDENCDTKKPKRSRPKKKKYNKLQFSGEFYKWNAEGDECMPLFPPYKVFVMKNKLREIKRESKTALAVARRLTSEIYTDEAIMQCTVSGRPSSARPGVPSVIRPALHADGVNAIFEYCKSRAKSKGWKEPTFTGVKKSIGDVLNETRYNDRLLKETETE